jgi:hypothetical protein
MLHIHGSFLFSLKRPRIGYATLLDDDLAPRRATRKEWRRKTRRPRSLRDELVSRSPCSDAENVYPVAVAYGWTASSIR